MGSHSHFEENRLFFMITSVYKILYYGELEIRREAK